MRGRMSQGNRASSEGLPTTGEIDASTATYRGRAAGWRFDRNLCQRFSGWLGQYAYSAGTWKPL
jgi:hypothetical protein